MRCPIAILAFLCLAVGLGAQERPAAEEPLATFLILSNPYITTLPPGEIRDERGSDRGFLAQTAAPSLKKALAIADQVEPDALIVLGSLTWSGSAADFEAFDTHFENNETPTLFVPGDRDELGDGLAAWRQQHGAVDASNKIIDVAGVRLVFADDLDGEPVAVSERLGGQLDAAGNAGKASAVLLVGTRAANGSLSKRRAEHSDFQALVEKHGIALELETTRYGHGVRLVETLPTWRVGSTGWSTRGGVTRVRVFAERIEIAEVHAADHDGFVLSVPNPVKAPRLVRVEDDPHACLSYTAELAKKPDYTVALISDPQFDRERGRDNLIALAEKGVADLNRLQPDLVFITGDLVNNNLPEEWELFRATFDKLEVPYHVVPGNHDVLFNYDFVEASYSSAPQKKPEYAAIVKKALELAEAQGFTGPAALYEKYTGSPPRQLIEHGEDAFITVPFMTQRADAEQVAWLREQLQATGGKRHVFVAAHYPSLPVFGNNLLPDRGGREVLGLLRDHQVTAFVFGHRHRNGFARFEKTAHILTDNMGSMHLLHIHDDHIVVGRKAIGAALYPTLRIESPR